MVVFLNGQFVPEAEARVSVFDRGFLYGDGLFETMLIANRVAFRAEQHLHRLWGGAGWLKLSIPYSQREVLGFIGKLLDANAQSEGLVRLTVTRGVGRRGYSPAGADHPTMAMSLHPFAVKTLEEDLSWRLATASVRLPAREHLAQFKTCNKLPQVLARAEAESAGADEALLLNTDGFVSEAASSNLFWVKDGTVCTPPLGAGILAGVTRAVVQEICQELQVEVCEQELTLEQLRQTDGVFVSLSSFGIVPAKELDGQPLRQSPRVSQIRSAYRKLVYEETGLLKS